MPYQPIENYGIIGDLRTVALVGMNGSIDFLCCPHFDSPSVFAALLDDAKGGRFSISAVLGEVRHRQIYLPDTNVLLTRFLSEVTNAGTSWARTSLRLRRHRHLFTPGASPDSGLRRDLPSRYDPGG